MIEERGDFEELQEQRRTAPDAQPSTRRTEVANQRCDHRQTRAVHEAEFADVEFDATDPFGHTLTSHSIELWSGGHVDVASEHDRQPIRFGPGFDLERGS